MTRQTWDPEGYARNARFVAELGRPVLELLAPRPGERILDLGCGDGALTAELAERGCRVTAVDASRAQVVATHRLGLAACVMDAARLGFARAFDAVFSNAVLHWVSDTDAVVAGVARALRPGGRFVGEFGGAGCVARVRAALHAALARRGLDGAAIDPWYFPGDAEYRVRLEAGGFRVESIALIQRPTPLPGDLSGWLETFAGVFSAAVPPEERVAFLAEVRERLSPALCDADGRWTVDYVRLRFAAHAPGPA